MMDGAMGEIEDKLRRAGQALTDAAKPAIKQTRKTATAADKYVHGNPWAAIGVGIAAGALLGFLAAKR